MILVLDFGSQYTQLLVRRLREIGFYAELAPFDISAAEVARRGAKGVILSGGPASVYGANAYKCDDALWELGLPILGVCYGMQLIAAHFGGEVVAAAHREFGKAKLNVLGAGKNVNENQIKTSSNSNLNADGAENNATATAAAPSPLFANVAQGSVVWMSHADKVARLPQGFEILAVTENSEFCAFGDEVRRIYGLQFHPEVAHSEFGGEILRNFAKLCGVARNWSMGNFAKRLKTELRAKVKPGEKVLCAVSGGVDSSVVAALLAYAVPDALEAVFVDNGLLRENEAETVKQMFALKLGVKLNFVDASELFLSRLAGVTEPEEKRKIIGRTFIEVFEREASKFSGVKYLAQGTLYTDIIESSAGAGASKTIKSHHNVGGLPERMNFELIEPLREIFKDEVRRLGLELGLSRDVLFRHPFPGPGLAIRILGEVTPQSLRLLRRADVILRDELKASGWYDKTWQAFCVLLNVRSVGVMGDNRTYENTICVRVVDASDGMTARFSHLPYELLERVSSRIINETEGINRVVYDISSKPPATIEWE